MCRLHEAPRIITHHLPDTDELHHDLIVLFPVTPDLILRACPLAHLTRFIDDLLPGLAAAMNTHDRTESAELEPADQQLLKTIVVDIAAVKSADIRGPPGNSAEPHMYARADLFAEVLIG